MLERFETDVNRRETMTFLDVIVVLAEKNEDI